MEAREAESLLDDTELVVLATGALPAVKELLGKCLAADIPAAIGKPEDCGAGCVPKASLLVREDDVRAVAELMQKEWVDMVAAEGTASGITMVEVGEDEDLPCPACGTAAPLVDGACSDCGLSLA